MGKLFLAIGELANRRGAGEKVYPSESLPMENVETCIKKASMGKLFPPLQTQAKAHNPGKKVYP